jgi:integrase/recombinase XerD
MHLYQVGMPLALLTEWLGHADPETTLIYAHADTEMKRHALEKANSATTQSPPSGPAVARGTVIRMALSRFRW